MHVVNVSAGSHYILTPLHLSLLVTGQQTRRRLFCFRRNDSMLPSGCPVVAPELVGGAEEVLGPSSVDWKKRVTAWRAGA